MPKSPSALNNLHRAGSEEPPSRLSEVALRKKKNADAQAAFRARRASYIATLEETVTSLESVVLQLQDSCHEARAEINELKQENSRIRLEFRERDKYWKALWGARKSGPCPDPDNLPRTPPSFSPVHSHPTSLASQISPSHINTYGPENLAYRTDGEMSPSIPQGPYPVAAGQGYPNQSPSVPYTGVESGQIAGASPSHPLNVQRMQKYSQYPYPIQPPNRSSQWNHGMNPSGELVASNNASPSQPPPYAESPTTTSPSMSYVSRYSIEDQQVLDAAPYMFPDSRSMSPTGSVPSSSSSSSIASPFQFAFPDGPLGHDHPAEYDYRRPNNVPGEVTLHGGTADISLASPVSKDVRYRIAMRRSDSSPDRPMLSPLAPFPGAENGSPVANGSPGGRGSSEAEFGSHPRSRPRRAATLSQVSRSPSPGGSGPPISGTLAVIKAQAFGTLRRTRTRKRASDREAAKVALDVLEARGMGMGVSTSSGSRRSRAQSEEMDI